MSEFHPNRVRPPRPRFTLRRAFTLWPALVWLGVVAMAFWAFNKGVKFSRMNGVVDVIQEAVTSDEDGRIEKILIKSGDTVKQNDPIVQLNTDLLNQEIAKFEIAIKADLENRILDSQFNLARLKVQLRELERDQAGDEGELDAIKNNKSVEDLKAAAAKMPTNLAFQIMVTESVTKIEANATRLSALSKIYAEQITAARKEVAALELGLENLIKAREDPESTASANGDLTELQKLRGLKARATIKSNHTGIVDRIDKDDGEFVNEGEAIVHIVSNPEMIRAFLPQDQIGQAAKGTPVWVSSTTDRYTYFPSNILSVSPRVNNVPDRSSPLPNRTVHGQEIIVGYPAESQFKPGQTVVIHLEEPGAMPWLTKLFGTGGQPQ